MRTFVKVLLIIISLLTITLYLTTPPKTKPTKDNFFRGSKNVFLKTFTKQDTLQDLINKEAQNKEETWAVAVKNLKNQKTYFYNERQSFSAASLYKLAVMWAVYSEINQGTLKTDDQLGNTSVENALDAMITISDNDSAVALAETVGWERVDNIMKSEGLDGFNLTSDNPQVTAKSTLDLFERIYRRTAISKYYSGEMETLLLNQKINDRIPQYLPPDIKIAHKTGELDYVRHDAGIIYGKNGDYIFVFLTNTPHPGDAPEEIALLTKKIYDELENQ